ncbi:hypothetical protein CK203_112298 [Vitis vinifera]|uniref:Uncharacterized protein n=1 Tax=Vitis vinifera TaxID=29760 RepID=A0A438CCK9_VITVI|nr:hypothetical protein CK203_112298 [Vitis vinifera]
MDKQRRKQNLIDCLKKRLERAKGKWWRNCLASMSLLDHAWATHRKYSLRSCIQHGYGHPREIDLPTIRTNRTRRQQRAVAHYNRKHDPGSSRSEHLSSGKFFKHRRKKSREVPSKLGRPLHCL